MIRMQYIASTAEEKNGSNRVLRNTAKRLINIKISAEAEIFLLHKENHQLCRWF